MTFTSWLRSVCARCVPHVARSLRDRNAEWPAALFAQRAFVKHCSRKARSDFLSRSDRATFAAESLELRTLLSVSALNINGAIEITADGADNVTVRGNASGQVEILDQVGIVTMIGDVNASAVQSITITGSDSVNVIDLSGVTSARFTSLASIIVNAGDGNDSIIGSADFGESLNGGDGLDTIDGQGGDDILDGGNGNDSLIGGTGNDSILGSDGADDISAGDGDDTILSGSGNDTVACGIGNDSVFAGNGEDSILGEAGLDTLNGDGGADTISGGDDNDSILGGELNDSLLGGAGDDVIDAQMGNDTVQGEAGDDSLFGGIGFDSLLGGDGQDFLNGGADNDTLVGGADNDTLLGGAGNDFLYGDEVTPQANSVGNDVLNGQAGNDTLESGGGNDSLDGGAGNDLLQPNVVDLSAGALSLSIDDATLAAEGDAGFTNVSVMVRLSRASVEPVTVDYSTQDDTALADADYQPVTGTLVFAAGQTTRTITLPVRGDVTDEANETLLINLANANGATISDAQAIGTINDDDVSGGLPQLTINDVVVNPERNGTSSFGFDAAVVIPNGLGTVPFGNSLSLVSGDYDRDGDVDFASGVSNTGSIVIFTNDGTGAFVGTVNVAGVTNGFSTSFLFDAGDLDGDGDLDLAAASPISNARPAVALNNGDGTFATTTFLPALPNSIFSTGGNGITLADLDQDGDRDIAVMFADGVAIYRNNGTAVFGAPSAIYFSSNLGGLAQIRAGDLDQDGDQDLVVPAPGLDTVLVLINSGAGTFLAPVSYAVGDNPFGVAVADLDGDLDLDVATANSRDNTVSVLLNNGNGTFAVASNIGGGTAPVGIVAADFDRDSDLDLAIADSTGGNNISIRLNNGNGTFAPILGFAAQNDFLTIPTAADFDGDGDVDFATPASGGAFLSVLRNHVDPLVFASFTISLSAPSAVPVTLIATTANGSATAGNDYRFASTPITIPAGIQSATFTVEILGDAGDEPNENFFVNLSAPTNAVIGDSQGHATVVDDDGGVIAAPTLTISDVALAEGNAGTTNFVFNVTLTRPAGNNSVVTVQYETADDSATAGGPQPDYTAALPTTLTFAAGVTQQQIVIPVNGDVFIEPTEDFFVHLLNPVGALLTRSRAIGFIQDDDGGPPTPLLLVNDVLIDEGNSGSAAAVVTVTLSSAALSPVSITLNTADGTARAGRDYSATTTTINIAVGATSGTASIPILGDTRDEMAEFFTIDLSAPVNALLTASSLQVTIRDDDGGTFSTPNDVLLVGGDGSDTVNGGLGNDTLNGGAGIDSLNGGTGNDSVLGGASADSIDGGDGNDTLDGQGGPDVVEGGAGNDTLIWNGAGDGNDTMTNASGYDTVAVNGTGAANTFAVGQTSIGLLTVTDGATTFVVSSTIPAVVINGNGGNDTIMVGSLVGVLQTALTINGGDGDDVLSAAGVSIGTTKLRLSGDAGNDSLTGSNDNDTLDGGDGADTLLGGLGNDMLMGGAGIDRMNGNEGNDSLNGGDDNDILRGFDGDDSIIGGNGDDSVLAGDGNDVVTGDAGADTLSGDAGNDLLQGNTGADQLNGGEGADTLDGGSENDVLTADLGDDLLRGGDGNDTLDAGDGNDTVIGGDGNDSLLGGSGNDGLNGGHGNDTLNGGAGRDSILGGDGNDALMGGMDADTLLGNDGDDTVNGQGSTDVLAGNEGTDVISDATAIINEAFTFSTAVLLALEV